jgi:adenosylmethionine-8-amino-7-oxononanoate aminotransferase
VPDIISTAKGLGAGYAPIGAVICRQEIYDAFAHGSRAFELGHTWDGAPLPSAVGRAVLAYIKEHGLVGHVAKQGPILKQALSNALADYGIVREVRGHGFLLGVEYVDPRDGESFLPPELGVARRIDMAALENRLIVYSTQPTSDGYVGDQTLLAPAFVSSQDELDQIVKRMAATVNQIQSEVESELASETVTTP